MLSLPAGLGGAGCHQWMEDMFQLSPGRTTCSQQGEKLGMVALPAQKIVINLPGRRLLVLGGAEVGETLTELVPISCSSLELCESSNPLLGQFPTPSQSVQCPEALTLGVESPSSEQPF